LRNSHSIVKSGSNQMLNAMFSLNLRLAARINRWVVIVLALVSILIPTSCGVYSFSGVSINAKSISIAEFYNNTDLGPANLGQTFTNKLKDYMLQNTQMAIANDNAELQIEGIVTGFTIENVAPTAATGNDLRDAAALSRLNISVKVTYTNTLDDSMSFRDRNFSFYENVDNNLSPDAISEAVINKILDQIILDIFNASVANW
jgi:hypothetical protein